MGRARVLASLLGLDGVLNAADVAGLAAVASSGSAADLASGVIPLARFPSGTVIQTVHSSTSVPYTAAGAGVIVPIDALEVSITPRSASSKFIITLHGEMQHATTPGDGHLYLGRKIGSGSWANAEGAGPITGAGNGSVWAYKYTNFGGSNGVNPVFDGGGMFIDSPNTTQTVYYKPYVGNVNVATGLGQVKFGHHNRSYFFVQEIQG